MAGTLTKLGLGIVLFVLVFGTFVSYMVALGNNPNYNRALEDNYEFSDYESSTKDVTFNYQELSEGSSINQQASDTAQLQEGISAEDSKAGFWSVINMALTDFFKIFPVSTTVAVSISLILIILSGSAFIYLIWGRVP